MTATPPVAKAWAVLAYTIAEDTATSSVLDTTAQRELKAICDAADFRRVSVAAQVDFKRRRGVYRGAIRQLEPKGRGFRDIDPADHELWKQVRDSVQEGRTAVRLQREAADLSAASAEVLRDFLQFGQTECPADRYVVSFFGHAAGPLGVFSDRVVDSGAHETLRLPRLVRAFAGTGRRLDVLLFRDCFMSCLEAAYQLRSVTEFAIATQALAPATGAWPWRAFMRTLNDDATPYDVGLSLAKTLGDHLDDEAHRSGFRTVPYALLDVGVAEEVAAPLTALTEAIEASRDDAAKSRACARALEGARIGSPEDAARPGDPALLDVPTMCDRLAALSGTAVARAAARLGEVVGTRLVCWHHGQTPDHRGVALFYKPVRPDDLRRSYLQADPGPVADDDAAHYRALALSKATGWHRVALHPLPVGD